MPSIKLVKKSSTNVKRATAQAKPGKLAAGSFVLQDNEDGSVTVFGVDAAGVQVDISGLATLTATSSDPSVLTVDAPTGATFIEHAVAPGHSDVAIVATWNDNSVGPFNATDPVDVTPGPVTGLQITHGTPTVH